MIRRLMLASLLALSLAAPAFADGYVKPDDTISFDLSAEDWVTTKTAHVILNVEAAVNAANAGSTRDEMAKAINNAAKADWKLTGFNRSQDQTGMERWSVTFDARLPEADLNGLAEAVKKASKPGLQISVSDIDFAPTLDEIEAVRTSLRAHIFKQAGEQMTALNSDLPGRSYRISQITFDPDMPQNARMFHKPMMMSAMAAPAPGMDAAPAQEHSQKLTLNAHIVFAALPPVTSANH